MRAPAAWLALLLAFCWLCPTPGRAAAPQPNFVVILADDLAMAEVGSMPNLRRLLAQEGITFDRAYVPSSVCAPARASFLTGRYPHNADVRRIDPPHGGYESFHQSGAETATIATWLQPVGYRTAYLGKYVNNYPNGVAATYVPPGWDGWYVALGDFDLYYKYNYKMNENGEVKSYGNNPADYMMDVLRDKTIQEIDAAAAEKKPFAIFLSPPVPHKPMVPAPRHRYLVFPSMTAPRGPSFQEADVGDKPAFLRFAPLSRTAERALDREYVGRLRELASLDEAIGSIVDRLSALDLLASTYVIFTSDNGYHLGQHRLPAGKITAYEEDIRVPLVVRGPGVERDARRSDVVLLQDLAPTIATLAGGTVPPDLDGRSLGPLLGAAPPPHGAWTRQSFVASVLWPVVVGQCNVARPSAARSTSVLASAGRTVARVVGSSVKVIDGAVQWIQSAIVGEPLVAREIEPASMNGALASVPDRSGPYSCVRPSTWSPQPCGWMPEYWALRSGRYTYVQYVTGDRELYDDVADPDQLNNMYCSSDPGLRADLDGLLGKLRSCKGASCSSYENMTVTPR